MTETLDELLKQRNELDKRIKELQNDTLLVDTVKIVRNNEHTYTLFGKRDTPLKSSFYTMLSCASKEDIIDRIDKTISDLGTIKERFIRGDLHG